MTKPGMGSRKGSAFERWISKDLSLWWSDGARNDLFWRTHSSGQLGTRSKKMSEYGDLMAIDDLGQPFTKYFHIECRHGKCIRIQDLFYAPKPSSSNMTGFINEGFKGADASKRKPIWFFREQGKPTMVIMQVGIWMYHNEKTDFGGDYIFFSNLGLLVMTYDYFKESFKKTKLLSGGNNAVSKV